MWKILLEEFWGDLRAQKLRAALTTLAVLWGTMAVVLLLSFGEGLKQAVVEGMLNAGEKMFMVYGGETSRVWEGLPKGRSIRLTAEDLDLLVRSIPEIGLVSPSYGRGNVAVRVGRVRTTGYMEGVSPQFELLRHMYPVAGGRFLDQRDLEQRRRVVFLGDSIAKELFGAADPVGRRLELDGLPFTVVGTMKKKFQTSMNNGPDADRIVIPATTFATIYGTRHVSSLLVAPRTEADARLVKRRLYEVLGREYRFDPKDERALAMWDFFEDERMTRLIGVGIQIFLGVVGAFTLLVAGVGVANIMYVVVRERTREIGVKLAIGARRRHIVAQFVFEALLLAFLGGLVGLALSAGMVAIVASLPKTNMAMEFIANPKLSWPIALMTVGILTAIGLVAGVFPARRAAAVDPVESLRYE